MGEKSLVSRQDRPPSPICIMSGTASANAVNRTPARLTADEQVLRPQILARAMVWLPIPQESTGGTRE